MNSCFAEERLANFFSLFNNSAANAAYSPIAERCVNVSDNIIVTLFYKWRKF